MSLTFSHEEAEQCLSCTTVIDGNGWKETSSLHRSVGRLSLPQQGLAGSVSVRRPRRGGTSSEPT